MEELQPTGTPQISTADYEDVLKSTFANMQLSSKRLVDTMPPPPPLHLLPPASKPHDGIGSRELEVGVEERKVAGLDLPDSWAWGNNPYTAPGGMQQGPPGGMQQGPPGVAQHQGLINGTWETATDMYAPPMSGPSPSIPQAGVNMQHLHLHHHHQQPPSNMHTSVGMSAPVPAAVPAVIPMGIPHDGSSWNVSARLPQRLPRSVRSDEKTTAQIKALQHTNTETIMPSVSSFAHLAWIEDTMANQGDPSWGFEDNRSLNIFMQNNVSSLQNEMGSIHMGSDMPHHNESFAVPAAPVPASFVFETAAQPQIPSQSIGGVDPPPMNLQAH